MSYTYRSLCIVPGVMALRYIQAELQRIVRARLHGRVMHFLRSKGKKKQHSSFR